MSQYVENVSGAALEEYQRIIRDYVRRRSGVYARYRRDRLYYVGLASNLRSRLGHHLKDKHRGKWDRFSVYLTIGDSHLKELESLVLRIVRPRGNAQAGKFRGAENLRSRLARDMRAHYRQQLADVLGRLRRDLTKKNERTAGRGPSPPLAKFLPRLRRPRKLRGFQKGKEVVARVRASGEIRYKGKTFRSPSLAARAAAKRSVNGWIFWTYERAPHDWIPLREVRR